MVRTFILYYLNIKTTHGYELQKFLQDSGLENWTQIKSGSIYYALNKLEKSKDITLAKEETHGSRVRRIYSITPQGKETLSKLLIEKLRSELIPITSDKFILQNCINYMDKATALKVLNEQVEALHKQKDYWLYWQKMKISEDTPALHKLSFEIPISNLGYSIKWHQALINDFDLYVQMSEHQELLIQNYQCDDPSNPLSKDQNTTAAQISALKDKILAQTPESKEALNDLISLLSTPNHSK